MKDEEIDKDLDSLTEIVLRQIANRADGFYHALYPYFMLDNGTHIEDIGVNPKRIAENLIRNGLAKPLDNEKCELTELGIEIGQGIGFKKFKSNLFGSISEEAQREKERQELNDRVQKLTLNDLEHREKIRDQEDRIRDLTEQLTFINLLKAYKWYLGLLITIGIALGYFLSLLIG